MNLNFERISDEHGKDVMAIFNYYVENSYAAYPESKLPEAFFGQFLQMTQGYPALVIKEGERVIGFSFLRAYNPMPVFRGTAEVSYFIAPDAVGRGIGRLALAKLEEEAVTCGITKILAEISSENEPSLRFHRKNGFNECGRFSRVGRKFGRFFDIVWMEKDLNGDFAKGID